MRLRALRSFVGLEGRVRRGAVFSTTEHRAAYLLKVGLAEADPIIGPTVTTAVRPTRTQAPTREITLVGGGWYEVDGRRYRGKAAAEAALERLP